MVHTWSIVSLVNNEKLFDVHEILGPELAKSEFFYSLGGSKASGGLFSSKRRFFLFVLQKPNVKTVFFRDFAYP